MIKSNRPFSAPPQRGFSHRPSIESHGSSSCPYSTKKPSSEPQTLAQVIFASTRKTHNELTTLLTPLLPRSLPPHTSSPTTYATGLIPIALIYHSFEALILSSLSNPQSPPLSPQTLSILQTLHVPALLRSQRIKSDICTLLHISPAELETAFEACKNDATLPSLQKFLHHINHDVARRPHVLAAYAYVLYNALFNGGCWMRAQLQTARKAWTHLEDLPSEPQAKDWGLQFWHFDTLSTNANESEPDAQEREDKPRWMKLDPAAAALKADFKARIKRISLLVSAAQRRDIVQEAQLVFASMKSIVLEMATAELDVESRQPEAMRRETTKRRADQAEEKEKTAIPRTQNRTSLLQIFAPRKGCLSARVLGTRILALLLPLAMLDLLLVIAWSCVALLRRGVRGLGRGHFPWHAS